MPNKVLFIGGGRMARAMAQGMLAGGVVAADHLSVVDHNAESQQWWAAQVPEATCFPSLKQAQQAAPADAETMVILAVKPHHVRDAIETARAAEAKAWKSSLVISVAAGLRLDSLCDWIEHRRVARVMPNTPSLVGFGASAYCLADAVTEPDQEALRSVLDSFGLAVQVPESQMNAVTGLSGSGPAYVFLFIEALADGGVMAGLPRAQALRLAAQTVRGAAEMVLKTGQHPGELKDAVASPGGTTIAAIRTLEHNAFRGAVIDAVQASARRSAELQ